MRYNRLSSLGFVPKPGGAFAVLLLLTLSGGPAAFGIPQDGFVPRPTGELEVRSGPDDCDGQECYEITVTCPEVTAPARARLKVGVQEGGSRKGTILLTTGGFGTFMYEREGPESQRVLRELREAGFATVQLQWVDGWLFGSPGKLEGHVRLACRPATVARWVHEHLPGATRAFCATGHSAGAAQISYMLTHYGLEQIFDAVVPTGGPPMGRMDLGCNRARPENAGLAFPDWASNLIDAGFGFLPAGDLDQFETWQQKGSGPCAKGDASFFDELRDASVASGEGDYYYPHTMVWFVFEGIDDLHAVAQGMTYFDMLMSQGSPVVRKDVVPYVTHGGLYESPAGLNLIKDILLKECGTQDD